MTVKPELLDRAPPNDPQAELAVIGAALIDPAVLDGEAGQLPPEAFYRADLRAVWEHLRAMYHDGEPIDLALVLKRLQKASEHDEAWAALLAEAMHASATTAYVDRYAAIVRRLADFRQLIHTGTALLQRGYAADGDPREAIEAAERALAGITTDAHTGGPVAFSEALGEAMSRIDSMATRQSSLGLPTGLEEYDATLGGLFPGELIILAARPGLGKTALASQIAMHIGLTGRTVLFATLEMDGCELATRLLCGSAGVSSRKVRAGQLEADDTALLSSAGAALGAASIWIDYRPGMKVSGIRRAARRLIGRGLALIVVDYLQRITPEDRRANRYEQVGQISADLKALAGEIQVPVLCLAQLGREADRDKEPKLCHLQIGRAHV